MRCAVQYVHVSAIGLMLGASSLVWAQPEREEPVRDAEVQPEQRPTPEQWRERLQARMDRARQSASQYEQALEKLERGEMPDPALMREFDRSTGDGPRSFGGMRPDGDGRSFSARPDHAQSDTPPPSVEQIRAFISRELPWLAERLDRADQDRPGSSEMMIRRVTPQIAEVMSKFEHDPAEASILIEQFRLGSDIVDAIRRIRLRMETNELSEPDLRALIRGFAERHYDLRLKMTRLEVERAETNLAELRARLSNDLEKRDEMIDEITERMMSRWSQIDRRSGPSEERARDGGGPRRP